LTPTSPRFVKQHESSFTVDDVVQVDPIPCCGPVIRSIKSSASQAAADIDFDAQPKHSPTSQAQTAARESVDQPSFNLRIESVKLHPMSMTHLRIRSSENLCFPASREPIADGYGSIQGV
jgi:hypothetical protein